MSPKTGLAAFSVLLTLASQAHADGLQAGRWKVTSTPQLAGGPSPPQVTLRCLSADDVADLGKTFTPEHRAVNADCEQVEHELTATRLRWRLKCTGQLTMDVAGTFEFDTPQHYTAVVTSQASIAGQTMNSRVAIEAERVGDCP
jgi:hypothetical protein